MKPPFEKKFSLLGTPVKKDARSLSGDIVSRPLKYIDEASVIRLLRGYAPVDGKIFTYLLDAVLRGINQEGLVYWSKKGSYPSQFSGVSEKLKGVPDKILAHNLNRKGLAPWEMFSDLDFDIVHRLSPNPSLLTTEVKAYFHHANYARELKNRRVVLHIQSNRINGTEWSISIPLQMLMKGWPTIPNEHIGYSHSISLYDQSQASIIDQRFYLGISKRNWLDRMAEHFREIQSGSGKTFHRAWREYIGRNDVLLGSELVVGNHTFDQIMGWEEIMVDQYMAVGKSLNMIPGGFKGIKFLHEHRLLGSTHNISLEGRENALLEYQRLNLRAGIPNLLIGKLWMNEEYAQKVICGVDGRLSVDQVREIRRLSALGLSVEEITEQVKALNERQVERVLSGATYSRIQ